MSWKVSYCYIGEDDFIPGGKNEVIFDDYSDALNFEYSLQEEVTLCGQHVNYNIVLSDYNKICSLPDDLIKEQTAAQIWEKDEAKNKLAESLGIKLIRIKEYDWINNQEEIKEYIKSLII